MITFGPPERVRPELKYEDMVCDQIKLFCLGESSSYNPPESGTFSLAKKTGRIPWWMVSFNRKDEVNEEDRYETFTVDNTGLPFKIERECLRDRWGRDFVAERVYSLDGEGNMELVRVSTVVSQESHGPRYKGMFYLHTQTSADGEDGGLSQRRGIVADKVRDLLGLPDSLIFKC